MEQTTECRAQKAQGRRKDKYSIFLIYILFSVFCSLTFDTVISAQDIKECEFCGGFYPADKKELESFIDRVLKNASVPNIDGEILGIISPHAGYIYSGPVAAYSYKILQGRRFDIVVILGQSHRYYIDGITIYPSGKFKVPNGDFEVDASVTAQFASFDFVRFVTKYFYQEHSLEVQLPFLAKTLSNVKIIPIVFGKVSFEQMQQLADKLVEISQKKNILVIVSSDFSHYLTYDEAVKLDNSTLEFIKNKDTKSLRNSMINNDNRACGINPIIVFLLYAKAKNAKVDILKYANSGDTAGDKSRVVGYVSAVAYIPGKSQNK